MKLLVSSLFFFPLVLGHRCPDSSSACPDTATCCVLPNKSYGCCPLENAVCCPDKLHCCPQNTKCSGGMCVQSTNANISSHANPIHSLRKDVVCPGGNVTCPDETSCCKNPSGWNPEYSCCPLEDAVCCNDGIHCCPSGTTCDVKAGRCLGDLYSSLLYRKKLFFPKQSKKNMKKLVVARVSSVICPDAAYQCPDSSTCCKTLNGTWGCCPFPEADCCMDKIHCCPKGMHCDSTSQYCSQGTFNTTAQRKTPAKEIVKSAVNDDLVCPDKHECDSSNTCCELPNGHYGCCPYANASCCADHVHCCPVGTKCDVQHRQCIDSKSNLVTKVLHSIFNRL